MRVYIIVVLACMITASCKKNNVTGQQTIAGRWELRQSSGGVAGTVNYNPGNGSVYVFDNMDSYQLLDSAAIVRSGTYNISAAVNPGDWILKLHHLVNSQSQTDTDSIRFSNNQLIFLATSSCCDMPTLFYEKLQY